MKPLVKTPQKILVMRYRFIGDTLLTVPFLRNLRRACPQAQIDVLVAPNSGELLARCPYINQLIYFDKKRGSFGQYARQLKANRYDTAFVLKRSWSSAMLALVAGIPQRVGFDTELRRLLLTHPVPYARNRHEVDCFGDVLSAVGIPFGDRHLEYWGDPVSEQKITGAFAPYAGKQNILIHVTSSNTDKEWPPDHWLSLVRRLLQSPDVMLHAVGSAADDARYAEIAGLAERRFINWCGKTSLDESMALLSKMQLVVGVDSGTLHMASAAGVPVIALFGPMNEIKWQPPGSVVMTHNVPCRPCDLKTPCRYRFRCITDLSADAVYQAVEQQMDTLWPAPMTR